MNRLLLFLLPDKQSTMLAGALSLVAFMLGMLDMLDKDFSAARQHLHLSVGIMAFLFVLKFLSMRATYQVAEDAQQQLRDHLRKLSQNPRPKAKSEAELLAQEKAEMAELVGALKQALNNIAPDSPVRPKYEATIELMERMSGRA
jgi:ABC-type transport system involved in cytochrome bd biosynthesis fused ATPase/permease subunit